MSTRPPHLTSTKPSAARARRVHLVMRDGMAVDGGLYLTDSTALAAYLGSRKSGWVNVVNATWVADGECHNHAVLQCDHILFATGPDGDIIVQAPFDGAIPRSVDIQLEDGTRVHGSLLLAERQRMSDYLAACGKFIPLVDVTRMPGSETLGSVVLNSTCVRAVRDAKMFAPGTMTSGADGTVEWDGESGTPSGPVNRETIRRLTGAFDVLTPGRDPDRRTGEVPYKAIVEAATASKPKRPAGLSYAEAARAAKLARHWLVLIATAAHLVPPDSRTLPANPTLEDLWRAIAADNEMAEAELALYVAAAFDLDVADLSAVDKKAIALVPEAIARQIGAIPLLVQGNDLWVAVSDPETDATEEQIGAVTTLRLRLVVATPSDIRGAIDWHYGGRAGDAS